MDIMFVDGGVVMRYRSTIITVAILLSVGACNQSRPAASSGNTQPASVAGDTFAQKSYYAEGRTQSIRLMSSTEIEISTSNGNFVGSYSREGNRIRAVFETLGSKQAEYFVETSQGLQAERGGLMYYTESALAALESQRARERAEEEARRVALAKEEARARAAAQAIEARCKSLLDASKVPTETIETFRGFGVDVILTDVGIKLQNAGLRKSGAWFGELGSSTIHERHFSSVTGAGTSFDVDIVDLWDAQRWLNRSVLASEINYRPDLAKQFKVSFQSSEEAEKFSAAVADGREKWRNKWHELVACR